MSVASAMKNGVNSGNASEIVMLYEAAENWGGARLRSAEVTVSIAETVQGGVALSEHTALREYT